MSSTQSIGSEHADAGWDDYQERVTRNEGRLAALEVLVAETREADRKLIEQRSESLADELERRSEAVLALSREERRADADAVKVWQREHEKLMLTMREATVREAEIHRESQDQKLHQNYEQSREAIAALEQRRISATARIEQMVTQWRDSDREARELFAKELDKHLDSLNHSHERMREFQATSVTRELWQAEKDAAIVREGLLRDQIIAIEKLLLTMVPLPVADKTHSEMLERMDSAIKSASQVLDNKIEVVNEKVADLRSTRDTQQGKSSGYAALYGWAIAAITLIIAVIVAVNAII